MAWIIKGHYVSSCTCTNVCPCPTASAPPDNPDGSTNCWGFGVWDVREGNSGDVDLSGIRFAISVHFPELVSNGGWQIGVTIDPGATDEQADVLGQILGGQMGGPFADMAPLIGEFKGVERADISYSDASISVGDSSVTYEPLRGQTGTRQQFRMRRSGSRRSSRSDRATAGWTYSDTSRTRPTARPPTSSTAASTTSTSAPDAG